MKENNKALAREWVRQSTLIAALLAASVAQSEGQTYDLSARNTSLQVDLSGADGGLSDWTINGVNQLEDQWFYYSVGDGPVNSIDTIGSESTPVLTGTYIPPLQSITQTNLSETYSGSSLSLTTLYELYSQPIGSGTAALGTTITLQNLSNASQTLHFYQYSDFWLGNTMGGQNVQFTQTGTPYEVVQSGTGGPLVGSLQSVSAGASVELAAVLNGQFDFQNDQNETAPTFDDSELSAGSGNVNFAYEFDVTMAPDGQAGSSLVISELQTVPEPSSAALAGVGMVVLVLFSGHKLMVLKKLKKKI